MKERKERHIKHLLAAGRKQTDGRGSISMYLPHACHHYEEIRFSDADPAILDYLVIIDDIRRGESVTIDDTPAMREASRTFVGYGLDDNRELWLAICNHPQCYPRHWPDAQVRGCEVFVHGVVTQSHDITAVTVPGPLAYCQKGCYSRTPHYFDVEVWEQMKDIPAGTVTIGVHDGEDEIHECPESLAGRKYQVVLRCEYCRHGYDLVTQDGSPSRWRRLMKDETARELLTGAVPNWEP